MDWLWLLVGYLFGSTPTGYLAVKSVRGEDIRNFGSGNIGATNVGRVMGRQWAVAVAVIDMLKGGIAVELARLAGVDDMVVLALVGLCGVLGHNFPVWLRFKGGKGVATSFGVLFFFHPAAAVLGGIVWYVTMRVTRYVSVASIFSLATAPVWLIVVAAPLPFVMVAVLLDVLTIFRHRPNIVRLLAGTESKVGLKKAEVPTDPEPVIPAEIFMDVVEPVVPEIPAEPDEMEDFLPDWSECPEAVEYEMQIAADAEDPDAGSDHESGGEPLEESQSVSVDDGPAEEVTLDQESAGQSGPEPGASEPAVAEEKPEAKPAAASRKRRRRKTAPVQEQSAKEAEAPVEDSVPEQAEPAEKPAPRKRRRKKAVSE